MGKREANELATRNKLIQVADRLISQNGYEATSVESITRAAGIAKGTFYNYFKRKEDVYAAFFQLHFGDFNEHVVASAHQGDLKSIATYLLDFCHIVMQCGVTRFRSWVRYNYVSVEENLIASKWTYDVISLQKLLQGLIAHQILIETTPIEALASQLMAQLYGFLFVWSIEKNFDPQHALQDFCAQSLPQILAPYVVNKEELNAGGNEKGMNWQRENV